MAKKDTGYILVPRDQAEQAGIDPTRHAYWNDPEKGLVGHPVRIQATHQLHCVVSDLPLCEPHVELC